MRQKKLEQVNHSLLLRIQVSLTENKQINCFIYGKLCVSSFWLFYFIMQSVESFLDIYYPLSCLCQAVKYYICIYVNTDEDKNPITR